MTGRRCPAGHRSGTADWCEVCGRPVAVAPGERACPVCAAPRPGRFCDECGSDAAVPVATAVVTVDPEWFAHVRARVGGRPGDRSPPGTGPRRMRIEHRRTVLGRRRTGRRPPDVDLSGDDAVSARHAVLAAVDDGWTVVDLGSRNGTSLGWEPLRPYRAVPVPAGGVIRLGLWTAVRIDVRG